MGDVESCAEGDMVATLAIERARRLNDVQRSLHMPTELSLEHFVLHHDWLASR